MSGDQVIVIGEDGPQPPTLILPLAWPPETFERVSDLAARLADLVAGRAFLIKPARVHHSGVRWANGRCDFWALNIYVRAAAGPEWIAAVAGKGVDADSLGRVVDSLSRTSARAA